jgi:hypothetical protein
MNIGKCVAVAAVFCALTGCAGGLKITKTFQDPSYIPGQVKQGTTVRVVIADNVDLRDFSNSFEKEYRSDQVFITTLGRQIADSMQSILGCAALVSDTPDEANILSEAGVDKAAVNKIHELLTSAKEDFYCIVNTVTIANRRITTAPMPMAGPAGGRGNMIGGGTNETAMVTLHVDLWNVKDKKKVLSYAALGESGVTMLFYAAALRNAVNEAVRNTVRYLAPQSRT